MIIGYEGDDFAFTGNAKSDILSITSVHPMRKEAVEAFLERVDNNWDIVDNLIREEKLLELEYDNHIYYARKLSRKRWFRDAQMSPKSAGIFSWRSLWNSRIKQQVNKHA